MSKRKRKGKKVKFEIMTKPGGEYFIMGCIVFLTWLLIGSWRQNHPKKIKKNKKK